MFIIDDNLKTITMNENDYGLVLTMTLDEIQEGSKFEFKVYNEEKTFVEKTLEINKKNVIEISLTQKESSDLKEGKYKWSCRQYIDNVLNNTLIKDKLFKVEEGA